jgi:hypothetical protein
MNAFRILKMAVLAVSLWSGVPAFGYQLTHDYYNRFRSPYKYNLYLTQQVNAAQAEVKLSGFEGGQKFSGNGLQLAAGMEHFRFIQTGAFFGTTQMQNSDKSSNEMRMTDSGVDAKMVMSTPVSNIIVGGAAVYSRANLNLEDEKVGLNGAGYRGSFEISYFASTQVSLVLSATHTVTNYSGKNSKGETVSPVARTSRLGAGLTVWL